MSKAGRFPELNNLFVIFLICFLILNMESCNRIFEQKFIYPLASKSLYAKNRATSPNMLNNVK